MVVGTINYPACSDEPGLKVSNHGGGGGGGEEFTCAYIPIECARQGCDWTLKLLHLRK